MTRVKERLIGAITVMTEAEALKLWTMIQEKYLDGWSNIDAVLPDEADILMLKEIENNPDCKEFVSSKKAREELGI